MAEEDNGRRVRVFCCYSHKDEYWRQRVSVHLKPLEREFSLDNWSDQRIVAGTKWKEEIRAAIDRADIAVLLISPDFLASDFIFKQELPPLLAAANIRGCQILPLFVSPCFLAIHQEIMQYQGINDPERPLIQQPEGDQEAVLAELTKEVYEIGGQRRALWDEPVGETQVPAGGAVVEGHGTVSSTPRKKSEDFLSSDTWPRLVKIGSWLLGDSGARILGSGVRSFLVSQEEYGQRGFTINTELTFSEFSLPQDGKLGMNAGVVLGWKYDTNLPRYYNILLTGTELIIERNGFPGDGKRWRHITDPVPLQIESGESLNIAVVCDMELLRVHIDGKQLLETPRPEGIGGRVGLRPWRSQLACTKFIVSDQAAF